MVPITAVPPGLPGLLELWFMILLLAAFEVFRRHAFRRIPVTSDGEVLGVITLDDLLLHLNRLTGDLMGPVVCELSEPQHHP